MSALEFSKFVEEFAAFQQDNRMEDDIEYPVEISEIESRVSPSKESCSWVSIRPVEDTKTYLGIYLGKMIVDVFHSYNIKTKKLTAIPHSNPAIYVPDLKRVVYGYESWWGFIDSPEKLETITDKDIDNIWYVKVLKELQKK